MIIAPIAVAYTDWGWILFNLSNYINISQVFRKICQAAMCSMALAASTAEFIAELPWDGQILGKSSLNKVFVMTALRGFLKLYGIYPSQSHHTKV